MPIEKSEFDDLYPCEFYEPSDVFDPELMYTVEEVARLLQGVAPEEELPPETEDVLLDWTIPWLIVNADDLVIADPRTDEEPGYYGLKTRETTEEGP